MAIFLFDVPAFIINGVPKQSKLSQYTAELAGHVLVSSVALKDIPKKLVQSTTANAISWFWLNVTVP
jgi:hypothetical protein